jgi:hypothetical protein
MDRPDAPSKLVTRVRFPSPAPLWPRPTRWTPRLALRSFDAGYRCRTRSAPSMTRSTSCGASRCSSNCVPGASLVALRRGLRSIGMGGAPDMQKPGSTPWPRPRIRRQPVAQLDRARLQHRACQRLQVLGGGRRPYPGRTDRGPGPRAGRPTGRHRPGQGPAVRPRRPPARDPRQPRPGTFPYPLASHTTWPGRRRATSRRICEIM